MTPAPNILIDVLPETVWIAGEEVPIETNFRTSILFELLMQDDSLSGVDKTIKALELYFPEIPSDLDAAVDAILWFYGCGKIKDHIRKKMSSKRAHERIYSFEYDDDYIYSAFVNQYGIDLQDIEYLHWWKFRALFNSLKEDNQFVKIMQYRSMTISPDMPKEQYKFYNRMKRLFALPVSQSESDKLDAIEQELMNGGDLSGLLGRMETP